MLAYKLSMIYMQSTQAIMSILKLSVMRVGCIGDHKLSYSGETPCLHIDLLQPSF